MRRYNRTIYLAEFEVEEAMQEPSDRRPPCEGSDLDEPPALAIRAAHQLDVEAMVAIYRDAIADAVAVGPSPSTLQLQLHIAVAARDARHVAVVEYEGAIVAWASIEPLTEAYLIPGLGEIRTHVARGFRDGKFDEALFWEAESVAAERLYSSLNCYAPDASPNLRCVCERFRYQELGKEHSRAIFAYDTGRLVIFKKLLGGTPAMTVMR
jgi:hypothetical protein